MASIRVLPAKSISNIFDDVVEFHKKYPMTPSMLDHEVNVKHDALDGEVLTELYTQEVIDIVVFNIAKPGHVIKQIRIKNQSLGPFSRMGSADIDHILLRSSECTIDSVYKHSYTALCELYEVSNKDVIPFYLTTGGRFIVSPDWSSLDLYIHGIMNNTDITVEVDYTPISPSYIPVARCTALQCYRGGNTGIAGEVDIRKGFNEYIIRMNRPVVYVILSYENIDFLSDEISLKFDDTRILHYSLKAAVLSENSAILPLTPSMAERFKYNINLSRSSGFTLIIPSIKKIDLDKPLKLYVLGITLQDILYNNSSIFPRYSC